jgi:hypothetical protein
MRTAPPAIFANALSTNSWTVLPFGCNCHPA